MINKIYKENGQSILCTLTSVDSLSADYIGPVRGQKAPKIILKVVPLIGNIYVCEKCEYVPAFCLCSDLIRDITLEEAKEKYENSTN